jgi:hypothetical protein
MKKEMKKEDAKYMQFPLCMLQKLPISPVETLESIISFGVYYYSRCIKYDMVDVMTQLMYCYYRNNELLSDKMQNRIENNVEIDEDYNGFHGKDFEPLECSGESLEKLLNTEPELRKEAIENYQLRESARFYGLKEINRKQRIDYVIKFQAEHEAMHGKQPMPSISIDMLFDYKKNPQDLELLMSYISIKSLIGQYKFTGTCKDVIVMRMIGAKSSKALENALKNKTLKSIYDKYSKRYWFDKLIKDLFDRDFLQSKIGLKRKIYLSTTLNFDELGVEIAKMLKSKDLKNKEKQAKEKLLQQLYNTATI